MDKSRAALVDSSSRREFLTRSAGLAAVKNLYFQVQDIVNEDACSWSTPFVKTAWIRKRASNVGPEYAGTYTVAGSRNFLRRAYVSDAK